MSAVPAIETAARRPARVPGRDPKVPSAPRPDGRTTLLPRHVLAAVLAAGLVVPLASCTSDGDDQPRGSSGAARDLRVAARDQVADGGTLRWAIDEMPETLNVFQPDAGAASERIAGATLPALFTVDSRGRPQRNADYLADAEVTATEPRQTVVYTLNPEAEWSDGRSLGVADFRAQWEALGNEDSEFVAARNAGYDRIAKVTEGEDKHQVKVVFRKPYADWQSLFTPLYPKSVMGDADAFNERARTKLPASGGPFRVKEVDPEKDEAVTLVRNAAWWGDRAKLERIELTAVPRNKRKQSLADGKLDLAAISPKVAGRIEDARQADDKPQGNGHGPGQGGADAAKQAEAGPVGGPQPHLAPLRRGLTGYAVRKALAPSYTQLALNGGSGPLADERVRRALARTLDRDVLAEHALSGLGLPTEPLGSHLRVRDQHGYHDNSDALGGRDVESAQALLADAGWQDGGLDPDAPLDAKEGDEKGKDTKNDESARTRADERKLLDSGRTSAVRTKNGKPLALRFLVPAGPGSQVVRDTGERIARMLNEIGVRTSIERIKDESYFRDHIASGDYDLALYAWPTSAYPATDAEPIFTKPRSTANGSLEVQQNYTRVGTDRIDQLFAQATGELDEGKRQDLLEDADARIWAAAGSVPLYQRPQLVAAKTTLANAGAFGFETPRYQDIGYVT